jgi:hypothetical protein
MCCFQLPYFPQLSFCEQRKFLSNQSIQRIIQIVYGDDSAKEANRAIHNNELEAIIACKVSSLAKYWSKQIAKELQGFVDKLNLDNPMLTRVAVVEDTGEESKKRKEVVEIEEVDNNQEETRGERDTSISQGFTPLHAPELSCLFVRTLVSDVLQSNQSLKLQSQDWH